MTKADFDGEELLALARLDIEQNRLDRALSKIKQGLALGDYPIELCALGAKVYAQLKIFAKAKQLYSQYLEVHPDSLTDQFQLGMVTFDSGDKGGALALWQELLQAHPTHPPALYYSSIALFETRKVDEAKRNIDVLLKSAPASNLYFERGKELLAHINKGEGGPENRSLPAGFAYHSEN